MGLVPPFKVTLSGLLHLLHQVYLILTHMHFSTLWKIISFLLSVNMVNSLGLVFVLLFLEHFGIFVKFVTFLLQSSQVSYMHVSSSLLYYTCWNIHVFFCKNFYWSNYALQICSRNSHLLSTYVKLIFSEFETNIQFEQWVNPYSTLLVFALVNCCKSLKNLNRRIEWHLSSSKRSISK